MKITDVLWIGICLALLGENAFSVSPAPEEFALQQKWIQEKFNQSPSSLPFTFTYNEKFSPDLLSTWPVERTSASLDDSRKQQTCTYTDSATSLVVTCVMVEYQDFPTVEWTVYFKNTGSEDTPILSDIQALDIQQYRTSEKEFVLHHNRGDGWGTPNYEPLQTVLEADKKLRFVPGEGRPSSMEWPYYNLEYDKGGMILAIGWPGSWAAEFTRKEARGLQIRAGQEQTHLILKPNEEIRSPLIVLQFWQGDNWLTAQNQWRRWMKVHNMPKPGGKLPPPMLCAGSSRAYMEMINANEENQILFIDRYAEEQIGIDYWWMDAAWYHNELPTRGVWPICSTYKADPERFPNGIRAISDHAHSKGIKTILWFEPENVYKNLPLEKDHPEWLLGGTEYNYMLNYGIPAAMQWRYKNVEEVLTQEHIDLYRQDCNMNPIVYWRHNEPENRRGTIENHFVTGYLQYWDNLRSRFPEMILDTCASGGRRLDIETLRRTVPLWRSDHAYELISCQGQTYGLSLWMPFYGTGTIACDNAPYYGEGATPIEPYAFWSAAAPSMALGFDMRIKELDYAAIGKLTGQWRKIATNYYGDYYPLTPYSLANNTWLAWQFNQPESGEGLIQAFRRTDSVFFGCQFSLQGLDPAVQYEIEDLRDDGKSRQTGRDLMEKGLLVILKNAPDVAVFKYQRIN